MKARVKKTRAGVPSRNEAKWRMEVQGHTQQLPPVPVENEADDDLSDYHEKSPEPG